MTSTAASTGMRLLYAERQAALVEAASRRLSGLLEVRPSDAGMHLVGWLPEGVDDQTVAEVAAGRGLETPPLSAHGTRPLTRGGLLLGYTAFAPEQIREAVSELARLLQATIGAYTARPSGIIPARDPFDVAR